MDKKWFKIIPALLFLGIAHQAPCAVREPVQKKQNTFPAIIEAKAGYFFFWDSKMRKIYDDDGLDLQIAATYPLWKWMQIYGSVEYAEKSGRSLHEHQKARIWEYPVTLGLQAVAVITPKIHYYFTLAPRYVYVHQHSNSSTFDRKMNHSGVGGFAGTGFHFFPREHFVVDLFGEYTYCRLHFHAHKKFAYGESAQVGGLVFGGGLGYAF